MRETKRLSLAKAQEIFKKQEEKNTDHSTWRIKPRFQKTFLRGLLCDIRKAFAISMPGRKIMTRPKTRLERQLRTHCGLPVVSELISLFSGRGEAQSMRPQLDLNSLSRSRDSGVDQ